MEYIYRITRSDKPSCGKLYRKTKDGWVTEGTRTRILAIVNALRRDSGASPEYKIYRTELNWEETIL